MPDGLAHHLAYAAHLLATGIGVLGILWLTRMRWSWTPHVLALGCGLMGILAFAVSDPHIPFHDFMIAYYPAGQAVLDEPAALRALSERGVAGFVNLPIVAYAFAPFGALPAPVAMALFTALGLGLILGAWRLLVATAGLKGADAWLLALLFAANGPLQNSLREGNTSHMVLFALAAALALLHAGRSASAGVVLAAAAVLKPPLALFALFFALRRDLRGTLAFGGVGIGLGLLSVAVFGPAQNLHWFQVCGLAFSDQWLGAFNVQSIPAFVARLDVGTTDLRNWQALSPSAGQRLTAQAATGLLYVVAAVVALISLRSYGARDAAGDTGRLDLQFLLVLCLAVVSSPLSWSHYYGWLLAPAAFFLGARHAQPSLARGLGWLAVFLLTPLVWPLRLPPPFADIYAAFAVSHLLFGGLLTFGLVAWRLAVAAHVPRAAAACALGTASVAK
jgi:alpha-1,2-mannosyltransferase